MIDSPWLPLIYQYGIGGLLFFTGIVIAVRKGAISLSNRHHRKTIIQLIAGFLFYLAIHSILILLAGGGHA